MKKYPLLILFFLFACHKQKKVGVDGALQSDFSFKTGSYWVYQDSATGNTDSMYVAATTIDWHQKGCVLQQNAPEYETITILLNSANDSIHWSIDMTENKLMVGFSDPVLSRTGNIPMFTYPIKTGDAPEVSGCVPGIDSGAVLDINSFTAGGNNYSKVAACTHVSKENGSTYYNDCYYACPKVGFVRMVFNHPADSVYRVMNLVRYRVVI